jgi:hypothetical protein
MPWELIRVYQDRRDDIDPIAKYLKDGWEPFSVYHDTISLRRFAPDVPAKPKTETARPIIFPRHSDGDFVAELGDPVEIPSAKPAIEPAEPSVSANDLFILLEQAETSGLLTRWQCLELARRIDAHLNARRIL